MKSMILFLTLITFTHIVSSESSKNCSAFHAFVEVQSTTRNILTSSQALFPPHTYYVPFTTLAVLSIEDDICNPNTPLSTNITNKVVLLFESIGICSIHSKVLSAELNGAIAVLMANDDDSGQVISIIDDDNTLTSHIPMRSIPKSDGVLLSSAVTSSSNISIKIGCFDDITIPSMLCVSDISGIFYWQSGEYQLQTDTVYNGHSVWIMHGYPLWRSDFYIYLHSDWYWAVTLDETLSNDADIRLKCSVNTVSDPSLCPLWRGTWSGTSFFDVPLLNVTDGECLIGTQQICIESQEYSLAGLSGTYTLHSAGAPQWFRDLTECDERASALLYIDAVDSGDGNSYWQLLDPLQRIEIATCSIPYSQKHNETWRWRPDLCTEWMVRNDLGLRYSDEHYYSDSTFGVAVGSCLSSELCQRSVAPDTLCLANNSILSGSLMGTFIRLNESGRYFDSPIYKRIETDNALYVWYANELYAALGFADFIDRRWWVLTKDTLSNAYETGTYQYYGYCQGYAFGNPINCKKWIFEENSIHHFDEEMTVNEGECAVDPTPNIPEEWPTYICIALIDETHHFAAHNLLSHLQTEYVIGGYAIDANGAFPQWIKPYNDVEEDNVHLFLSSNGRWQIGNSNQSKSKMQCDAYYQTKSFNPIECKRWYDDDYELLDNINVFECSMDDIWTASPTYYPTATTSTPTLRPTAVPTPTKSVCLSRNGTVQSLFEGIYNDIGTDKYGTIELFKDDLYIWYHEGKWVISPVNHSVVHSSHFDYEFVYGYCSGEVKNGYPFCDDCWQFYWSLSRLDSDSKYITDCSFMMSTDLSICSISIDSDIYYSDSLCINDIPDNPYKEDINELLGEYVYDFDYGLYFHSDSTNIAFISYDTWSNHWSISNVLLCDDKNGMPFGCVIWDSEEKISKPVVISITVQCMDNKKKIGSNAGKVVGIVIGVIVGIIGIAFVVQLWLKFKKKAKPRPSMEAIETEICKTEAYATTKGDDETTRGYDMSPLNEPQEDDDDDNDHDDHDVDDTVDPLTE